MIATDTPAIPIPSHVLALPMAEPIPLPTQQPRPITISEPVLARLVETKLAEGDRLIVLVPSDMTEPSVGADKIGVLATVHQSLRTNEGHLQALIRPMQRVRIEAWLRTEPHVVARIESLSDEDQMDDETVALARTLGRQFDRWLDLQSQVPAGFRAQISELVHQPGLLSDVVAANLELDRPHQEALLQQPSVRLRLDLLLPLLEQELQMLEMGEKIQQEVRRELGQNQRALPERADEGYPEGAGDNGWI